MPRLFIAIDLPATLRRHLTYSLPEIPGVRWVARDNLHLTIRFAGEVSAQRVHSLSERLAQIQVPNFALGTGEAIFFPNERSPRILAIQIATEQADYTLLTQLHSDVSTVLKEEIALEGDWRPFRPHVTLGRMKEPGPGDVHRAAAVARSLLSDGPYHFPADTFVLYESVLRPGGPVYRPLRVYRLQGAGSNLTG